MGRPALRGGVPPRLRLGVRRPRDRLLGRPPRRLAGRRGRRLPGRQAGGCSPKHDLKVWTISNHLTGQAVCDDPIDERHHGILSSAHLGRRRRRGRSAACGRGDEDDRACGPSARRRHRRRLHRLRDLEVRRDVPARHPGDGRRRLPGLRRPLEPDPRRLRRGGRPLRPRGAPLGDRLRLLDDGADAWRRWATARRSA